MLSILLGPIGPRAAGERVNNCNVLFERGLLCDPVQGAALDEEDAGEAR